MGTEILMPDITAKKVVLKKRLDLVPYEKNSRIHSDVQIERLTNAINEWGFTIPILIDEENRVIAGHGRLFAADSLEMEKVPCIVAQGWTDAQKRAYVIADNKLAEGSAWNDDLYWSELQSLLDDDFNVDLIGVDIDPVYLSFEPNVSPVTQSGEVEESDMARAEGHISNNIQSLSTPNSDRGIEVICPYCAELFKFSGS